MKDLDFDELDKAVNSLMTSVPKTPTPADAPDTEKTLDITPTLSSDEPFSLDKLDTVTAEAVSEALPAQEEKDEAVATAVASMPAITATPPATTPPPAARRGGRFMDVVHPSSDMKTATIPSRPISRQGSTIEPSIPSRADAPRASTPFVSSPPLDKPAEPKPVETSSSEPVSSESWPDPLEMSDFKDDVVPKEEEWSAEISDMPTEPSTSEQSPLTSPFLPDTKVEKRPLGNGPLPADDEPDEGDEFVEPREDKTIHDPDDQLPPLPGDVAPHLPDELQSDLMNIEADTHMGMPKTELTHPSDEKLLESGLPEEPATKAVPIPGSTGPVSIPQQYHEEPSTGDQKNGGIYDTDSYHSPLEHPAKKKSGWMWIVWILIILLIGAGAGAALYFSGLV